MLREHSKCEKDCGNKNKNYGISIFAFTLMLWRQEARSSRRLDFHLELKTEELRFRQRFYLKRQHHIVFHMVLTVYAGLNRCRDCTHFARRLTDTRPRKKKTSGKNTRTKSPRKINDIDGCDVTIVENKNQEHDADTRRTYNNSRKGEKK